MSRTYHRTPNKVSWVCPFCDQRIGLRQARDAIEVSEPGASERQYAHGACVRSAGIGTLASGTRLTGEAARAAFRVIRGGKR
jgi:hypothetical protein